MLEATVRSASVLVLLAGPALIMPSAVAALEPTGGPQRADTAPPELSPCLLVVAGSGTKAQKESVTEFWHTVNVEIAKSLVQQLAEGDVSARLEVIPQQTPSDQVPGEVATALARERCRQLLQFTHKLGGGSGPDAFFAFEAVVLGVKQTARGFKLQDEVFRKTYRHPLTQEVLRSLSMPEVAKKLKDDLSAAGVLPHASAAEGAQPPNAIRLLRASPAFTGENAGRELVRVVAIEDLEDRKSDGWLVEVEWREGGSLRTAVAPIVRQRDAKGPVLFNQDGWALVAFVPDMTIGKAMQQLTSARATANEAAALGDVRSMISAQFAYTHVNDGTSGDLPCLLEPANCLAGYDGPDFLWEGFVGSGEKAGYLRTFHKGAAAGGAKGSLSSWAFTAVPVEPGKSGFRGFCGDESGRICTTADGSLPPVSSGRCAEPCQELK